ncbi:efflux transporter outer membrane subunit [Noviherbaspirillum pedocola]|uniref:Efflux transporter outer membrane subunit n=1 Tax=Noviherbaspirillum pedocola TaxID=2801341 RepID=A0A934SWZ9_9BURK|nr:efflux transporter outer membrane subunit [Noviherbaspirillum pedocola]MBK4733358.1 efflux transporter outer membrane subunit [Noviherbaspirillum pedocola]
MMKSPVRLLAIAAAATALAGCSLTPEIVKPQPPVAEQFPQHAAAQSQRPAVDIGWREFFTDPRLQQLIETALANNRDLRTAALNIEQARALYNVQRADVLPTINGTANASRARTPGALSASGRPLLTDVYQVGLGISAFELDFFGRVRALNQAALASYLATEEAQRVAQISLVSETAKAFLAELAAAEQLVLAQRTLAGRQQGYELAKQRFDVGASSALDLRLSETLVESARVSVLQLQRQRAQAHNALVLLVGAPIGELAPGNDLSSQQLITDIPAGLPSDLLTNRPDIRAAEQRLRASYANIGVARAAFFPRISLTAGYGTASTQLSNLFSAGSSSWNFTPQLTVPLFDWGRNRSNLQLAEVRRDLTVTDYEKTIQTAFREVADALVARGTLEDQVEAQRRVRVAEVERLNLAQQRFKNGVSSSLDVLDAERELFTAEQTLVQTRLLRLTNAIDVYRSLGGGLKVQ